MALAESLYRTVDTLHSLGNSNRMIAVVIGVPRQQINDYIKANGVKGIKDKPLKMAQYKNAALTNLAINAEDEKNRIAALRSIDVPKDEDDVEPIDVSVVDIKQSILDELKDN